MQYFILFLLLGILVYMLAIGSSYWAIGLVIAIPLLLSISVLLLHGKNDHP